MQKFVTPPRPPRKQPCRLAAPCPGCVDTVMFEKHRQKAQVGAQAHHTCESRPPRIPRVAHTHVHRPCRTHNHTRVPSHPHRDTSHSNPHPGAHAAPFHTVWKHTLQPGHTPRTLIHVSVHNLCPTPECIPDGGISGS